MKTFITLTALLLSLSLTAQFTYNDNSFSGIQSFSNQASGVYSFSVGRFNYSPGDYSTALGYNTHATGSYSTTFGVFSHAPGNTSAAMGYGTIASDYGSLVIGVNNLIGSTLTSDANNLNLSNTAFVIGNGADDANRSDALSVLFDGTIKAAGSVTATAFIGDGSELTSLPLVIESIIEGGNTGVRLSSASSSLYGDIGNNALDLTFSNNNVSSGATGDSSVALGENTTASGTFSTAIGVGSQATGQGATALGSGNIASGWYSTVSGFENSAMGHMSVALGKQNQSSGEASTAFGSGTEASGDFSTAMGLNSTASGLRSFAVGDNANSSAEESFSFGESVTASGDNSITLGQFNEASGVLSVAIGSQLSSSAQSSTAFGYGTTASGDFSTALGYFTNATGSYSTTLGVLSQAPGNTSAAMGYGTIASDYGSLVIGVNNLIGSTLTSDANNLNLSNTAFVIGNGADDANRSDALSVLFDGTTTIAGDLSINSDARLKANIISLGSTLAKLLQIDGKIYTMKKDENKKQKIGVLAQDIEKVFPELVSESNGVKSVNYQGLVPVLINALKEQDGKMKKQEKRLERLEYIISTMDK